MSPQSEELKEYLLKSSRKIPASNNFVISKPGQEKEGKYNFALDNIAFLFCLH